MAVFLFCESKFFILHSSFFIFLCTFAGDMRLSDKWTNAILAVLAAVLLALCIRSVVHEQQSETKIQQMRDGRDK